MFQDLLVQLHDLVSGLEPWQQVLALVPAGAADDPVDPARLEVEVDPVERDDGVSAAGCGEDLAQSVESDHPGIQASSTPHAEHAFICRNKRHSPAGPHVDGGTPCGLTSVMGGP